MRISSLKTLVLYARYTDKLSYYDDWQHAFENHPGLRTQSLNICERKNLRYVKRSISEYDLIVLLHSVNADTLVFIEPYRSVLKDRRGKLLSFVGNEVNLPRISMKAKIDLIRDMSAEFIGTQLPLEAGRWLYAQCRDSRVVALPHALNPEAFMPFIPNSGRPIDIGARSNQYWSCLGDNERNDLFDFFLRHPFNPSLKVDINTKSRFDRSGWCDFLNQCKGTISNEAGSYYLEHDDSTVLKIQTFVESQQKQKGSTIVKPDSLPERLWRFVPEHLKKIVKAPLSRFLKSMNVSYYSDVYEQLDYKETFEKFFKDTAPCPVHSKAISSRHFEAAGTKTCQIMLEGKYNDILKPDEHFISLKHDLSNIDDVMKRFGDAAYRKVMVDRTYEYIMDQHTYRHRMNAIRDLI
jgi:hypothetical protein